VRAPDPSALLRATALRKGWSVDVDPVSLI
jgi:hypothetical protein